MEKEELMLRGARYFIIQELNLDKDQQFIHTLENGTELSVSLIDICNYLSEKIKEVK